MIAGLAIAVTGGLVLTRTTARIDNAIYDRLVRLRSPAPSDRIIIVAIDDPSVAALGQWPWPRSIHGQALDRLAAAPPAAIGYDVLFTERSGDLAQDERLADALRHRDVALPLLLDAPGSDGRAFDVVLPVEPLRSAAGGIGHVALPHDEDGEARAALLFARDGEREWAHMLEVVHRMAMGAPSPAYLRAERGDEPAVLVPFAPAGAFRQIPFKDVLAGRVPDIFFEDRIVLVGVTAAGLGDRHNVGSAGILPGVEVQANVLNALLADRFVRTVPLAVQLAASILPSLLLLLLFWQLRPSRALAAAVAALVVMSLLPVMLIVFGWWLPPTPALLGLLIVYPLWGWRRLQAVERVIARELELFAGEKLAADEAPLPRLDPPGRSVAQLSHSIAALRDLKRLISDTIEGVADPLIVTAMNGDVLLANGPAQAILDRHEAGLRALRSGFTAPEASSPDLTLFDGRSFSPRRTPLRDATGRQRGWIILLAEITAIRAAERDRDEALEFLSHDMRAPQSAIITLLERADRRSVQKELASHIASHARRTLALADDFVQLARLRTTAFEPMETDLCDALAEAMDAAWPQASSKGVRVVRMGSAGPCCVMGEHHALTRALHNLIDNAVKFSPAGAEVHCTVINDDRLWSEISIEDRGPGVAGERLDRLFERFGPLEPRGGIPSAGLGLSYVQAVTLRHGGELHYAPVSPSGARFTMRLPAASSSSAALDDGAG